MSQSDTDVNALQRRIRDQQALLAEVLPALTAYYEHKKANTDRSAIHQGGVKELKELIDRVAKHSGRV